MLTGTRAFGGKTVTETLAAVMRDPPDWSRLPVTTPSDVRTLVQRCLRKDPRQRLQAIGDARVVLDDVLSGAPDILPTAREAPRKRRLILELAGAALVAAIAALAVWALKPTAATAPPIRSFTVALPAGQQLASLDRGALAFSDEGNLLAYVAALDSGRGQQIYIRAMDSGATRPILGTEGGSMPFFSPDGDWLGFLAGGRLKKVPLKGGPIAMLTDAPSALGATWSRQHTIVFASLWSVLQQIPEATGGTVKALTQFAGTENSHAWPQTVADSGAVLFTSAGPDTRVVAIGDLTSGVHRDLIAGRGIIAPGYVRSGHLVYLQDNNLMAVPLDLAHRAVEGDPVLAVQRVRQYAVSSTGSLAYVSAGSPDGRSRLTWVSRSGVAEVVDDRADNLYQPRLDPVAGKRIAVDLNSQVWIFDLTTHNWTPFTFGGLNQHAVWTKDGNELVFMMQKGRTWQLARQAADGSGQPEAVMSDTGLLDIPYSVMPDGSIGVVKYSGTAESQFWVLPTHKSTVGTRPMRIFSIPIADAEAGPAFSPDGHWLAYAASDASGQRQIYVQAYPEKGAKHQISIDGGNEPVWNPDDRHGLELFYRNGDDMMAAEITTTPDFRQGRPHRLFAGASDYRSVAPNYVRPNYDFSAGDQRFLMLQAAGRKDTPATEIHVVLNWSEDLKRLAPAARTQ
jgi:serine/threonine-protein kinase